MTREFNRIHLENNEEKISEMWSQIHPPLRREFVGSILNPAMLTDVLVTKPPFSEYQDIFSKRKFYNQALTRYHTSKDEVMKYLEPVPTEVFSRICSQGGTA